MSTDKDDLDYETTGHEWDGILEYNKPLPRWWLWTFYLTIVWGVLYSIAYPAWPGIRDATPGLLGFSTRANVAEAIAENEEANAAINARLVEAELTSIPENPELLQYATSAGAAVFRTWCAQCHGSGAAGVQAAGYPNLLDDAWLWGGDLEAIHQTIAHGIRYEADEDTHVSEMPAFADILEPEQVQQVAAYVVSLSDTPADPSMVEPGKTVFAENCAACHGENAEGLIDFGAPRLSDGIWLKGSTEAQIAAQIRNPKHGVMPAWVDRLGEPTIKQLAVYVHTLGGGQ